jgi:hypothetical protein
MVGLYVQKDLARAEMTDDYARWCIVGPETQAAWSLLPFGVDGVSQITSGQ